VALRKEEKKERETGVSHLKYASVLDHNFKQKVTAQHTSRLLAEPNGQPSECTQHDRACLQTERGRERQGEGERRQSMEAAGSRVEGGRGRLVFSEAAMGDEIS